MAPPDAKKQDELLARFRAEIEGEGFIHEGDSIGTDDETLRCALSPACLCPV